MVRMLHAHFACMACLLENRSACTQLIVVRNLTALKGVG